jgi:ABC-type lipoprotein export system ATPase subunit
MIIVTHDATAAAYADRVLRLEKGMLVDTRKEAHADAR